MTDEVRDTIWDYIQTLFVIGETIVSDSDSIKKLVENFKKMREANGNVESLMDGVSDDNLKGDEQVLEMLKTLSDKTKKELRKSRNFTD